MCLPTETKDATKLSPLVVKWYCKTAEPARYDADFRRQLLQHSTSISLTSTLLFPTVC